MLATLMVDPSYFLFRLITAAAEGLVTGIYKVWQLRQNKKIAKKIAKSAKKATRPPPIP